MTHAPLDPEMLSSSDFSQYFGRRPRVIIGHPMMGRGGSESNVMWLIEALKQDCDVTVLTTKGWDLDALNHFYGTAVESGDVRVRIAWTPLPPAINAAALRGTLYQRCARRIAPEYDLCVSAYNPTDWGCPAVHFIGDFTWHQGITAEFDPVTPGWQYEPSFLRSLYLKMSAAMAQPSGRDFLRNDLLAANSEWSARMIESRCAASQVLVVFPPVWVKFPDIPWDRKSQSFVAISRISPEKRIERILSILGAVREAGHDIRLHLCGAIGDDAYGQMIARLCAENGSWVTAEGQVTGDRKAQLLAGSRFGIQTRAAEPFGISVAEMVKAGAVVFTPAEGGQAEIVNHPRLLFKSDEDAVQKIIDVLSQPARQQELRAHLATQASRFSAEAFVRESRHAIAHCLVRNSTAQPAGTAAR